MAASAFFHSPASMTTADDELVVLDTEPGAFGFFAWKNVTIIVWMGPGSTAYVARLALASEGVRERFPKGGSSVHIVLPSAKLPDNPTRDSLVRLQDEYGDWLAGLGIVIGGSGFWASTMRSVITAMRLATKRAFELRIQGSVEEIAAWLPAIHEKRNGVVLDPARLLEMLRQANSAES
jgi:hypothetical protein